VDWEITNPAPPDFKTVKSEVVRCYEKFSHDFLERATEERYPRSCWQVYAALLLLSHGRARFRASAEEVWTTACVSRSSYQTAVQRLEGDDWIIRHANFNPSPHKSFKDLNLHNDWIIVAFIPLTEI
jgi:hypothetical protein